MTHPAIELGQWLKERGRGTRVVLRVFAGQIEASPAKYAEVEAGVVCWIEKAQTRLIPEILGLSDDEKTTILEKLNAARQA